ncbi:phosphate ABC transporter permease PstA [Streptacidiphilus anmyonensis]|uniref:phosphate ABC transporter permease PstA n=1 Tax=Streptacidiphilus anmyonensis TaxID=405782 RepID=UPI000A5676F3|nr:phosphate ABC transporter permease PstA [Streptacidiphilus anmyonensis]
MTTSANPAASATSATSEMSATSATHAPEQTPPRTTVVVRAPLPPGAPRRQRRRPGAAKPADRYAVVGALAGSVGLTTLLFRYLLPFDGPLGFVVTAWLCFLGLYALLVAQEETGLAVRDRLASAVVHSVAALVLAALVLVVGYVAVRSWDALPHGNFYTQDMSEADSLTPLTTGGVLHAVIGSLEQIGIALVITVPLGIGTAVFLSEVPGAFSRFVRTLTEAMTALPSVLAGLFIYAVFVLVLGWGRSGFAAGCALSVMMLPIIIRAADVVLRLVPASLKEASYALGASRLRTVLTVVLPTARSGLMTAVILGTARGIGETSPVLLTAGYNKAFNANPFNGPQVSLPLLVFTLVRLPSQAQIARGFGAAMVLLVLVIALFILARVIGGRPAGVLTSRQQRRRAAASSRLALRFPHTVRGNPQGRGALLISGSAAGRGEPPTHVEPRTRRAIRMSAVARAVPRAAEASATSPAPTTSPSDRRDAGVRRRLLALLRVAAALTALSLLAIWCAAPRALASDYVPISGAGSTWSSNAMDAWATNVKQYGMQINFDASGSSDGRAKFKNGAVDFAVSEIPYGITDQGVYEAPPPRKFAYMPIVAGGTAFMYNLKINGRRVTNLRLSGDTIAGIFTGTITKWNDPAIAADNPQLTLPARTIVPVVRSDGSGTTAQLTTWMSQTSEASKWNAYCVKAGRSSPCGITSFYPVVPGTPFQALSGSQGVSGFVAQDQNEGSITYVEYSYALNTGFPVAKMLNASHYYVEPTAPAVAVGLTSAQINSDLTQKLGGVYNSADPRAYPLSSYSYMILPTAVESGFNTDKGRTLGAFAYYFLCQGQQQAPALGYSPLPINLVQAGLTQIRRVPGVQAQNITIKNCNNPTFSSDGTNTLAKTAPYPPACDKQGPTQCSTGTGGAGGSGGAGSGGGSGGSGGAGGGSGVASGGAGTAGATGASAATGGTGSSAVALDPGLVGGASGGAASGGVPVNADPVAISADDGSDLQRVLMVLAAVLLASVVVLPPMIARRMARKKGGW